MSKKQNTKFITPDILKGAVKGAFIKLNPRYMMKNPVMFVVEIGFFITLLLSFVPGLFGDANAAHGRSAGADGAHGNGGGQRDSNDLFLFTQSHE